jgi:N-alpha-acetyltransferase 30
MENIKPEDIKYRKFMLSDGVENLQKLIETELSEPYSIYLYRHFAVDYTDLTFVAEHNSKLVGCILGKYETTSGFGDGKKPVDEPVQTPENFTITDRRGYIAMIAVSPEYRNKKIGKSLVQMFMEECRGNNCDFVQLETESVNIGALKLYESSPCSLIDRLWLC